MSAVKMSEAQRHALEAIRDGKVSHSILAAYATGYSPWSHPHDVQRQTIQRVVDKRLARVGRHSQPGYMALVELTDAGREALKS